ncbi:hypothetical protein BN137_2682 [Cronobacter condimenti 1330]|uniref:Uncharacterized protein n=1 Tax=Cronobacter condimenti 1330 TaxID=1073999 RepID=K8A1J1_9ENTR|nr:hypothetical protein BN137_2682 [Cronobacter condimenti 1330]
MRVILGGQDVPQSASGGVGFFPATMHRSLETLHDIKHGF